ncbi:hypothetical protein INR77_06720 [Erythrobacter sp. SCSIO 43205]|nr:hypothetical protein [Erythrobacter sp. SCSIO 43205]UAB79365.1 hypothetical protein INR77_06720 [Erythrobacter sp. SCSIO 43205]
MKTLSKNEIESVAGGFPVGALPLVVFFIPRPTPKPADEPVTVGMAD